MEQVHFNVLILQKDTNIDIYSMTSAYTSYLHTTIYERAPVHDWLLKKSKHKNAFETKANNPYSPITNRQHVLLIISLKHFVSTNFYEDEQKSIGIISVSNAVRPAGLD